MIDKFTPTEAYCKNPQCSKTFLPKRPNHIYCCPQCAKSGEWLSVRKEVIRMYGNKCQCCGEERLSMLAINHKNNDGHLERRVITSQTTFYRQLLKNPLRDDLEVLCANCNNSIQANAKFDGKCDHQRERERAMLQYTSEFQR